VERVGKKGGGSKTYLWKGLSRFTDGNRLSYNCFRQPDVNFNLCGKSEKKGGGLE
jgi:hypothetical protein